MGDVVVVVVDDDDDALSGSGGNLPGVFGFVGPLAVLGGLEDEVVGGVWEELWEPLGLSVSMLI